MHWLVSLAERLAEQLQNVLSLKETMGQNKEKYFIESGGLKQSNNQRSLHNHYLQVNIWCFVHK